MSQEVMEGASVLVADLERVERDAWRDLAQAAPASFVQAVGLETASLNGALYFCCARMPVFQFNWLSGTGLGRDDGSSIAEAVRRFRAAGATRAFVQLPPGPNVRHCTELARAQGLVEHPLAWAKFHRRTAGIESPRTALRIVEATPAMRDDFTSAVLAGFAMPTPMRDGLGAIVGRPNWKAFIAHDGSTAAGGGALYVNGDFAWLGIASVRPEFRKRGGQSALLAHRLAVAASLGARHAVTETGVPLPGQAAPSYANILRAGFSVAYVRPNWTFPEAM